MNYEDFEALLKQAKLSKKEFSEAVKMNYTSVTNWKQTNSVPEWVESWIENYKFKSRFHEVKEIVNKP